MRTIKVGMIGLGTVGGGVVRILQAHKEDFKRDQGAAIELVQVAALNTEEAERLGVADIFTTDGYEIINNPDIDIVIEVVGGTGIAKDFIYAALKAGKRVVTANKAVMATDFYDLLDLAGSKGVELAFETSVGGGIPIIGALRNSLIGNRIESVLGIVNGTTNYMLTQMAHNGSDYNTVLKEAQELGYAEADPTADVEGHDAAAKIAILTTLAFNTEVHIDQVPTEGITQITPLDITNADDMGYVIKLLAISNRTDEGIDMRVHPTLLPKSHALASVNGVFNAIFVVGDSVGETMFYGEGAGAGAAASAIVGDLIEISQRMTYDITRPYIRFGTEQLPLKPIDEVVMSYYLRLPVPDKVGVVAATASAFAAHNVSIDRMMQSPSAEGSGNAELIYVTHPTPEGNLKSVLQEIEDAHILSGEAVLIRML